MNLQVFFYKFTKDIFDILDKKKIIDNFIYFKKFKDVLSGLL